LGIEAAGGARGARQLLVLSETAREHMIRAAGDWPRALGVPEDAAAMGRVMRLWERLRKAMDPGRAALAIGAAPSLDAAQIRQETGALQSFLEETVLGEPVEVFEARRSAADFQDWRGAEMTPAQKLASVIAARGWADAGHAETRFLPDLDEDALAARLFGEDGEAFVAAPTWRGEAHETSALGRQQENPLVRDLARSHGNGLLTRLAARLVEIAALPGRMRGLLDAPPPASPPASPDCGGGAPRAGRGLAQVEAARGRLIHGVLIADGLVRRYAILAPTEWNFHPGGSARRGLEGIAAAGRNVREVAGLFVGALDPCVAFDLRVR